MTAELTTTHGGSALVAIDFDELERATQRLAGSYLMPKHLQGKPDDVFATLMMGRELGLSYTASINGIYVVHGKPAPYSATMVALVKSSPVCKYWRVVGATDTQATIETVRHGSPEPERVTFTMADAKRAGYTSNKKYSTNPAEMLTHKAGAILARRVYPDVLHGLHTVEELQLEPQHVEAVNTPSPSALRGGVSLTAKEPETVDAELVEDDEAQSEPDPFRAKFQAGAAKYLGEGQLDTVADFIALAPVDSLQALATELQSVDGSPAKGKAIIAAAKAWEDEQ